MSLGDLIPASWTTGPATEVARYEQLLNQVIWADRAGFWAVHVGEHHFSRQFLLSSPPVLLAAMAAQTQRIHLSTAVTLAANLDPVRIAEDYATVDVLSHGRVEIVFGRGTAFPDTFRWFGQDIATSRERYEEGIELVQRLLHEEDVHWEGQFRAPLDGVTLRPRPFNNDIPMWIAGGTEASARYAAELGFGLLLPTTSRLSPDMVPVANAYRERWERSGQAPSESTIAVACHMYVGTDEREAKRRFSERYRHYCTVANPVFGNPFDLDLLSRQGPAIFGTPAQCVDRIEKMRVLYGHDRQLCMFDFAAIDDSELHDCIDLFGEEVLPIIRDA